MSIKVAVIGAGCRGQGVTACLLRDSSNEVDVTAVYDPDMKRAAEAKQKWQSECRVCSSYQEAIDVDGVEWVLVFSPNAFHKEHILAGFAANKHVFTEKPLATTIADCKNIHDAAVKAERFFATGFVLRYAPIYKKVKAILDSGVLGNILSIDANENITAAHGGYIMGNWRRQTQIAGPHILEKCCHDLDLINWFCDSLPGKIASFGGRNFFTAANAGMIEKYGSDMFQAWEDPHRIPNPFSDDNDLMDNQVSIILFRNQVRVMFQNTMCNAIPERRMYFSCTEGTMVVELYSASLRYRKLGDTNETVIDFDKDGHGGGDDFIMKELFDTMKNGTAPKCSGNEGLNSAVFALAIDQAARTNQIVDLEPVWQSLGK
jgi:predicted dehydrogenase